MAVQLDIKTFYDDGSAKTAIITTERPRLAAGTEAELRLTIGSATPSPNLNLLDSIARHDLSIALSGADGATQTVDVLAALRDGLAQGTASMWQQGPLAAQARVEIDGLGASRLIFDVTVFKGGGMAVEAQVANDGAMQTEGGRIAQHVAITLDGRLAADVRLDQGLYQTWHTSLSSNDRDGGQGLGDPSDGWLNIRHDIAALQATGAVASYDLDLGIDAGLLDIWGDAAAAPGFDAPLGARGVTLYMPGTGGRADIGFTTAANTGWLISQDPRAAAYALGQAEAASAVPWHMWDAANDTWLGPDAYPRLWTDPRGGIGLPGDPGAAGLSRQPSSGTGWTLDSAHQPDLSYVPYLLTGARWMLDNLQAQASWSIMSQWSALRGETGELVVQGSQVRGAAWSLRQIDEAAWVSPEGSAEKAAFGEASAANWAWLVAQIPLWTEQQGEAHGWVPGDYGTGGALPPWQQDYFASTTIAAAKRGNADAATFLEWQANFLVGRFTHADEGFAAHDGAAYLIAIADPATGVPYKTWEDIGAKTVAKGWSNGDGWSQSQGDYAQLALATLAGIAEVTGSTQAADAYRMLIADAAPFTGTGDFLRDPTYWLEAPSTPPVVEPPVVEAPVVEEPAVAQLRLGLSGDAWNGDALVTVLLDGVAILDSRAIGAVHAMGEVAYFDLTAPTQIGAHVLTVRFLNDAWGGQAGLDRNLYVDSLSLDGVDLKQQASLYWNRDVALDFQIDAPPPAPPTGAAPVASIGTGPDVLRLGLSADSWAGDPHFVVLVNGNQIGGVQTVASQHSEGATSLLDVYGDFGAGAHTAIVRFLDDAWGGSAGLDRNLYVDSLSVDGIDQGQQAAIYWNSDAVFHF